MFQPQEISANEDDIVSQETPFKQQEALATDQEAAIGNNQEPYFGADQVVTIEANQEAAIVPGQVVSILENQEAAILDNHETAKGTELGDLVPELGMPLEHNVHQSSQNFETEQDYLTLEDTDQKTPMDNEGNSIFYQNLILES